MSNQKINIILFSICILQKRRNFIETFTFLQSNQEELAWLAGMIQSEAYLYLDKRNRSKLDKDDGYEPPPPSPNIKIDMIEKDVMNKIGRLVDQPPNPLARKTTAGNVVYRVSISKRSKAEALLRVIRPYITGTKNASRIDEMLKACDQYHEWVANGGYTKQAQRAAKTRAQKAAEKKAKAKLDQSLLADTNSSSTKKIDRL